MIYADNCIKRKNRNFLNLVFNINVHIGHLPNIINLLNSIANGNYKSYQ